MPTVRMNVRSIDALKPPAAGRVEYFDDSLAGFGLRIAASNRRTWIVLYRHKGRLRRLTIGTYPNTPLADARDAAKEALRAAERGGDPAAEKKGERLAETFKELAEEYLERYAKVKKRSWRKDEAAINNDLLPKLGPKKAKDVLRKDVLRLLDGIIDRGSPIQANRTLEVVRKIFNWGIERGVVEANPCHRISKPSPENRRDRVLSDQEIKIVWAALDAERLLIAAHFKVRLLTAQRGGELLPMRWSEIDPPLSEAKDVAWWTIPAERSKNGLAHRVPLSPQVISLLRSLPSYKSGSPWVFPSPTTEAPIGSIWKAVARVVKRSGVDFDPHDLRRTAASSMASMGINRLVISKVLNHVDRGVTSVYDRHSYDAEKRYALNAWARRLDEILAGEEASNVTELKRA